MSEGTKLGADLEFDSQISQDRQELLSANMEATRLGQMSDFERSLMEMESESGHPARRAKSLERVKPSERVKPVEAPAQNDFEQHLNQMVVDYQEGDIVKGVVRSVEKSGVLVDFQYKSDGFIANNEFSTDPSEAPDKIVKPGDPIHVMILKLETKEGFALLSSKRAMYELVWTELVDFQKSKEALEVFVSSRVEGGLVAIYKGIKGFVPSSHILKEHEDELDQHVGRNLKVAVLQADRRRRKVVFSQKLAKSALSKVEMGKLLEGIEVGQVREGRVSSIKDFGVFVDLGGVEGLVHISELSWARVNHPSDLVAVGDHVKVFVLGVDRETRKISLGMKQLQPDPWENVGQRYQVGQIVEGTISRLVPFGAFIQLEPNLEGLIHISELLDSRVEQVSDVVKVGQIVQAKIIKLLPDEQRIGLSLKAMKQELAVKEALLMDDTEPALD